MENGNSTEIVYNEMALIVQTSAVKSLRQESDARMGKVTRSGQFSVAFSGRGFPRSYTGHPPRPIDGHRLNRSFYTISEPIYCRILVYLRVYVFLRLMLFNDGGIILCTTCDQKCFIPVFRGLKDTDRKRQLPFLDVNRFVFSIGPTEHLG